MQKNSRILITGGLGFIGSALIKFLISNTNHYICNIDKVTYASNLNSLGNISQNKRYSFYKENILNQNKLFKIFKIFKPNYIFHLAAETHVDKSILNPLSFIKTNVLGTAALLNVAYKYWTQLTFSEKELFRFLHISTDEVFGDLEKGQPFNEKTPYNPSSPYSASKASSDHFVRAWYRTFKLPVIITNCSNNYGPFQHQEKFIPLTIHKILNRHKIPVYGNGLQVRDWLHVDDHVEALYNVMSYAKIGETYNIGGNCEKKNLEVVNMICEYIDLKKNNLNNNFSSKSLINFVNDRPGHDNRYAIDNTKIRNELKWTPKKIFNIGLVETIDWYISNFEN